MKEKDSNKQAIWWGKASLWFLTVLIWILISGMLFILYDRRYEQKYGLSVARWFTLRELLEIICVICLVISLFFTIKTCLCSNLDKKFELFERAIIYLLVAGVLFMIFGFVFCVFTDCNHTNCITFGFMPLIAMILITLIFRYLKKIYVECETSDED